MRTASCSWTSTSWPDRWRPDDLNDLSVVFAKPEVWSYPHGRGFSVAETRSFLDGRVDNWKTRGWSQWAVVHRADERLIGFLGLEPPTFLPEVMPTVEVDWRLDPDYRGHGLAPEGGRAALRFGFDVLGLDEIVSIYEPENVASGRVMERIGMRHALHTTHPQLRVDLSVYKILHDWRRQTAALARGPGHYGCVGKHFASRCPGCLTQRPPCVVDEKLIATCGLCGFTFGRTSRRTLSTKRLRPCRPGHRWRSSDDA